MAKRRISTKDQNLSQADLKVLVVGVAPLLILVALSFFLFRVIFERIDSQRTELEKARKEENILVEKVRILSSFESQAPQLVEGATIALPHTNASLMMMAQLRSFISFNPTLNITNLRSGPLISDKSGLSRYEVQFDLDGGIIDMLLYLDTLSRAAPLSRLETFSVNSAGSVSRGNISMSVFTAPLPEQLPPITAAIEELSTAELAQLGDFIERTRPPFVEVEAEPPTLREDPFN